MHAKLATALRKFSNNGKKTIYVQFKGGNVNFYDQRPSGGSIYVVDNYKMKTKESASLAAKDILEIETGLSVEGRERTMLRHRENPHPLNTQERGVIEFEGKKFESGGALVTDDRIIAYPDEGGVLKDWHGNKLGTWRSVGSWPVRNSAYGTRMHQIEAKVNGVTYTGRGFGVGMSYSGKRKAGR